MEARVFQVRMLRLSLRRLIRAWSQKARKNARKPEKPAGKPASRTTHAIAFAFVGSIGCGAGPGLALLIKPADDGSS